MKSSEILSFCFRISLWAQEWVWFWNNHCVDVSDVLLFGASQPCLCGNTSGTWLTSANNISLSWVVVWLCFPSLFAWHANDPKDGHSTNHPTPSLHRDHQTSHRETKNEERVLPGENGKDSTRLGSTLRLSTTYYPWGRLSMNYPGYYLLTDYCPLDIFRQFPCEFPHWTTGSRSDN